MTAPRQVLVALGANLGDRAAALACACAALGATPGILSVLPSPVYETDPVGPVAQPAYLNAVAALETTLGPEALLSRMQAIEAAAGRRREAEVRWGPRTLDLDILLFEGESRPGPGLEIPHPRLWERTFVTVPLADLLADTGRFPGAMWEGLRTRLGPRRPAPGVRPWTPPRPL